MTIPPNHNSEASPVDPLDQSLCDLVFLPEVPPAVSRDTPQSDTGPEPPILTDERESEQAASMVVGHTYSEDEQPGTSATETLPIAVFAIVAAVAAMPMFLTHLRHLSHLPHRAHYGLVLLGFAVLVYRRWFKSDGGVTFRIAIPDVVLLIGSGLAFAAASRASSPWIGVFSCILLAGFFLRRLPSADGVGYVGPWAFLFLLLPLPLGFDQAFVRALQAFATGSSSRLLDLLNVNHMVSGNVLELPGSQLFIDEACSGIQSLFAMLTAVAFFAAWQRKPAILAVPLLISSVIMCTIVNILRIVIVVHGELRGINLVTGWPHDLLGSGLFVLALGLVYGSEGFLLYVLAPIVNPATGTPDDRAARVWNNLTNGLHGASYGVIEPDRPEPRKNLDGMFAFKLPTMCTRAAMYASTICFAFFGISQHVGGADPDQGKALSQVEEGMLMRSGAMVETSLPETIGPCRRVSFERIDRSGGPITDSVAWVYRSPFYEATISLDYPFFGAHNVSECYDLTGWDVQERITTQAGYSKATLNRPFGEAALLFYDVFDVDGTVELETTKGKLAERFRDFENSSQRPTWQLQLIIRSDFGLSGNDLRDIEAVFLEIRSQVRAGVLGPENIRAGHHAAAASPTPKSRGGTQ